MNFEFIKLDKNKVTDDKGKDLGTLLDFLKHYQVVRLMLGELTAYIDVHQTPQLKRDLRKKLEDVAVKFFENKLKDNQELTPDDFDRAISEIQDKYTAFGDEIHEEILKSIDNKLNKNKVSKIKNGGDMFKTIKEAKEFTSHLDSLAGEIETLNEVSPEMRKHLAYRLDRLSDLIEISANKVEKKANGVGSGSWAYDEDEARYMSTFGGTGALQRDSDETYMDEYLNDDHKEVLERKEPMNIKDDGAKKPQPSDNYKEAPVAQKLRGIVKEVLKQMND